MTLFLLFVAFVELLGLVYAFFSVYEILGCLCLAIELKVGMKVPMTHEGLELGTQVLVR
jgi:hypothetical protein